MELARTKGELLETRMELEILEKAAAYFAKVSLPGTRKLGLCDSNIQCQLMSRVLGVSASVYYAWRERLPSKRFREEARLEIEIRAAHHKRTWQTCGPERLQGDLAEHSIRVGVCRTKRLRKKLGIRCKQVKKFKATTDSKHNLPVAENLLNRQFEVSKRNAACLSDKTHVPTDEGWLYLAGHKDIFNCEIVGYAIGARMTKNLISQSLFRAVAAKRPAKGLIHHSDRGSQYCAHEYRKLLEQFGMKASMSRRGNSFDIAPMEFFWEHSNSRLVHHRRYRARQEAIQDYRVYRNLL